MEKRPGETHVYIDIRWRDEVDCASKKVHPIKQAIAIHIHGVWRGN